MCEYYSNLSRKIKENNKKCIINKLIENPFMKILC